MSKLLFHIGDMHGLLMRHAQREDWETSNHAVHQDDKPDAHITFRDADHFFSVMTAARVKLMEYIHARETVPSVRALARGLNRDYANVHADVAALLDNGLLEKRGNVLMVTWDGEDDPESECGSPAGYSDGRVKERT